MCGIICIINDNENKIIKSLDQLNHRGPDGGGFLKISGISIGHVRLSILDQSQKAAQPLESKTGRYLISFNGEIYNFRRIANYLDLDIEKLSSDTLVLSEFIEKYEFERINELRGMFSFCVFDKEKNQIILSTDHFGQKQLYFLKEEDKVKAICSEIKPLLKLQKESYINKNAIEDYIRALDFDHNENTFFSNIKRVEPGHILRINVKTGEILEDLDYRKYPSAKNQNLINNNQLDLLFRKVVEESLEGDFKHAMSLSGGLDGLFLLNCIKSIGKLDKIGCCYTVEFEDFSEGAYASQIANYFGLKHKIICYSKKEFFKSLKTNINFQEGPIGGLMNCGLSYLAEKVKKDGFKTILGGMALDELFGGYDIFSKNLINENVLNSTLIDGTKVKKDNFEAKNHKDKKIKKSKFDTYGLRGQLIFGSKLRRNLRMLDRLGMQNSIEFRSPFLDWDIFSFAMNYDENKLNIDGLGKQPIRQIINKCTDLELSKYPKKSIQAPQRNWLCDKSFIKLIKNIFNNDDFFNKFSLNKSFYMEMYFNNLKSNSVEFPIWQLINIYLLNNELI